MHGPPSFTQKADMGGGGQAGIVPTKDASTTVALFECFLPKAQEVSGAKQRQ